MAERLVYYPDSNPGIRREKRGRGFSYINVDGTLIDCPKKRRALQALAVPPAYTDVWMAPIGNAHLLATGRDARTRKQYRYHPDWSAQRSQTKFEGLGAFGQSLPRLRRWIDHHLSGEVGSEDTAVAAGPVEHVAPFDDTEAGAVARAVEKRRNEFHTGRRLARLALAKLGCAPAAIPADDNRVPIWPDGFVGTISHCRTLCIAQVGLQRTLAGIGIDVETDRQLSGDLAARICRPDENPGRCGDAALVHFVAKEAFYKAYYPQARVFLEFHDVRIEPDEAAGTFQASIIARDKPAIAGRRTFTGRFTRLDGYIVAAVWIKG